MRYIPNHKESRNVMLQEIGVQNVEDLFATIPTELRTQKPLDIDPPTDEFSLLKKLKLLAGKNHSEDLSFLGGGSYRRFIPSVISPLVSRGEFLTSYTPYQPEISQGTLQAMFEFQTLMAQLTGMDVANGSMYEGATAAAEAILMAKRIKKKGSTVLISKGIHPEYLETITTYLKHQDLNIELLPINPDGRTDSLKLEEKLSEDVLCVLFQSPNFFGVIENQKQLIEKIHLSKALAIVAIPEMTSLGLLAPPGEFGADIVIGEGQSLGLPLAYGGPYLGVFAAAKKYMRQMPGRLSGETIDNEGKRAFTLTLATREQHIRREKATSNICSNQALCALWVTIYLSLLGKTGLKNLANLNFSKARYALDTLTSIQGIKQRYKSPIYNEFVLDLPLKSHDLLKGLASKGIHGGIPLSRFDSEDQQGLLVTVTEVNTKEEIDTFSAQVKEIIE